MPTDALFRDAPYERSCEAVVTSADADGIMLDRTVFYATSGGQPGDTGQLSLADGATFEVIETVKGDGDGIIHKLAEGTPLPTVGSTLRAEINWARRHRHMRMHTCLHLLTAVISAPITGAQLTDEKGRIDFNLPEMTMDKAEIQARLNELITEDHPVVANWISEADLDARPELIKTMSIRPPVGAGRIRLIGIDGIDLQPCGGTHVARTGEIGNVTVRKIESKGKQNRRISVVFADG